MTTLTPPSPTTASPTPPTGSGGRTWTGWLRQWITVQGVVLSAAVVLVVALVLVPILYLLAGTFFSDGQFTLKFFAQAYLTPGLGEMVLNSFVYSVGSTIVALFFGTALAYLVARTDTPLKSLVYAAALVPLIIPGVLHTVAWIFLASPQIGSLNVVLAPIFGEGALNVFSMPGMIVVEGFHMSPLIFLLMYAAFRNMDSSLEESALMSGASMMRVLLKITLPLVKPALLLSTLIMFIRAMSSFEVPALLGSSAGIFVFTSRIFQSLIGFPADYGSAGAYSIGLLAILGLFAIVQMQMSKRSRSYQTVSGKGFRPTMVKLGRFRLLSGVLVGVYFFVTSILPLAALVYTSLLGFYRTPSATAFRSMSLDNYVSVFTNPQTMSALQNSLLLAVGSATIVMFVTSLIAWLVVRARTRGSAVLSALTSLPLGIPGLIMGVALLFTYLRVPVPIYGSLWILLIAYVTIFLPYGITYASSAMYQISGELEESGRVCGAGWWSIFRKVTLPLLMPGLIAGWTFIVLIAVRELGASLLLYSPGQEVLAIMIWEEWADGELVQLAALGVVMIVMLVVLVTVARRLGAKVGVQSS
jgi:iron(III) transport system permease protein